MRAILILKDSQQEDEDDYRDVESTIQEEQEIIMDQVEEAEQESSVSLACRTVEPQRGLQPFLCFDRNMWTVRPNKMPIL